MSRNRVGAWGARACQLCWLNGWDGGGKGRGRGTAGVKAAMGGSGRSTPLMGRAG